MNMTCNTSVKQHLAWESIASLGLMAATYVPGTQLASNRIFDEGVGG